MALSSAADPGQFPLVTREQILIGENVGDNLGVRGDAANGSAPGLIDWLTLRVDLPASCYDGLHRVLFSRDEVCRRNRSTGVVRWSMAARETLRSDSHQVSLQITATSVTVAGSPARAMGLENNVFGSGDLRECARAMVGHAQRELALEGVALPGYRQWTITRIDSTTNHVLQDASAVRQALAYLRQVDGGRYKIAGKHSESVYFAPGSRMQRGKLYHKGPHLRRQLEKGQAKATAIQLRLSDHILRLEHTLGAEYMRRVRGKGADYDLKKQWSVDHWGAAEAYWAGLIGDVELTTMNEAQAIEAGARIVASAMKKPPRDGGVRLGRAAYGTWIVIKEAGYVQAREQIATATWYRHLTVFKAAGLKWGDIASGRVIPIRREPLVLRHAARDWAEVADQVDKLAA
jgi:II/X family phage/plasmid replication protein